MSEQATATAPAAEIVIPEIATKQPKAKKAKAAAQDKPPRVFKQELSGKTVPPVSKWAKEVEERLIAAPFSCRANHATLTVLPITLLGDSGMTKGQAISSNILAQLFVELGKTREAVKAAKSDGMPQWYGRKARYWMLRIDMALTLLEEGNPAPPDPPKEKKERAPRAKKERSATAKAKAIVGINPNTGEDVEPATEANVFTKAQKAKAAKAKTPPTTESPFVDKKYIMKKLSLTSKAFTTLTKHPLWPKPDKTVGEGKQMQIFWRESSLAEVYAMMQDA